MLSVQVYASPILAGTRRLLSKSNLPLNTSSLGGQQRMAAEPFFMGPLQERRAMGASSLLVK
jgi:hypothetical protein